MKYSLLPNATQTHTHTYTPNEQKRECGRGATDRDRESSGRDRLHDTPSKSETIKGDRHIG